MKPAAPLHVEREGSVAIRRILVPVDFSETSLEALNYALDLARRFQAQVSVLHVVEPVVTTIPGHLYAPAVDTGAILDQQIGLAREHLAGLERKLNRRGKKVRSALVVGTPYLEIVERAKKTKADLVVMATHGRTGLSHLFIGSVAEKVVRSAPCPVLTLRPSGRARRKAPRTARKRTT
jgi:nucleotide-binding universal stress UspA family protein